MFEFPCIVSLYYIRNQQDVTLAVSFISHCKITLHVTDAFCVHHQECISCRLCGQRITLYNWRRRFCWRGCKLAPILFSFRQLAHFFCVFCCCLKYNLLYLNCFSACICFIRKIFVSLYDETNCSSYI
jgi:hypothetical protein